MPLKKLYLLVFISSLAHHATAAPLWVLPTDPTSATKYYHLPWAYAQRADSLYQQLQLANAGLEKEVFFKAYKGYLYLLTQGLVQNAGKLTIADFSQSSRNKRLYVIDLELQALSFQTFVSHGKNSGGEMATSFSNQKDSYKSTLGFLITSDTYVGSAGYSLRFQGVEPGINDRVRFRDIIVHGSRYVNEKTAEEDGKVGNSLGCPAVPMAQSRPIIDAIKGGSVYFIYHPDEFYNATSPVLNAEFNSAAFFPLLPALSADSLLVPSTNPIR
jgi:hypothetical protein